MEHSSNSINLQNNPAQIIEQLAVEFVRTSQSNRLSFLNDYIMWDEPLIKFADGDDPLFEEYKTIISPSHLTPREALTIAYDARSGDSLKQFSVISWILPITKETRKSQRAETLGPSRLWSHTRWYGEKFNDELRRYLVDFLTERGYLAVAPAIQPYFKKYDHDQGPSSNWSERHIAYVAGHGTFGLSDGFITERGIAHRCGSVVTNLELPPTTRTAGGPYSNCLFYMGVDCRACVRRCPVGAITDKGHDKIKCQQYQIDIGYSDLALQDGYNNDTSVYGCGLCQTKVPCESKTPKIKAAE